MKRKIGGRIVDVASSSCEWLACLRVGRYTHHSAAGASGCSSWTDPDLSCLTRVERGCPPPAKCHVAHASRFHAADCPGPRYPFTVRKGVWGFVRCMACKQRIPRPAIVAAQQDREARK